MRRWEETGELARLVLRLESERLVAIASIGRTRGATPERVASIDRDLETIMAGLERRGSAPPLHVVASRYGLSGGEFAIVHLALMPHHAPDLLLTLATTLDSRVEAPLPIPRLSYALRILAPSAPDQAALRRQLRELPVCTETLVILKPLPDGDERLEASPALLELLGLAKHDVPPSGGMLPS